MVANQRLARNLVSLSLYRSPTVPSSSSSHSPVNLRANCPALDSLRTGNLSRWIRMRTVHQVLTRGTQILSRTQARRNLLRDRKKSTIGQSSVPHNLTITPLNVGYMDKVLRMHTTETWSSKGRQNGAGRHQRYLGNIYDCVHKGSGTSRKRF